MAHILQTKDKQGFIRTIAKFDSPVTQEQVHAKYGPGYYCLKQTSPRFQVIWKDWLGISKSDSSAKLPSQEILSLKRKINYLALGEGLLAAGEAIGFGATALKLRDLGSRVNRTEFAAQVYYNQNPIQFTCSSCGHQLPDLLDNYCANCGNKIVWPSRHETVEPTGQQCLHCGFPVKSGQRYCRECGRPTSQNIILFRRLS